uniref:Kinesin family member 13A n=1 Tax=Callorhinchus milii TaxID=7868 RepID=A0A4W3IBK6_CALMI
MDEANKAKYAGQEIVFKCLGEGILENAFQGYNACIFAYGQTGSGKSFSMMGNVEQPGLIPRLCGALFERVSKEECESHTFKVEVSYMEIYNEKVRDLLDPKGSRHSLKVREHKVLGPYVDGLSQLAVTGFEDIESLMSEGNKSRTVAATNMNEESSRSHAVFNIILTQTLYDVQSSTSGEKVSKLSLVDLAGSERVSKTGAAGERLKEGSNINKSLTTLGLVISALADKVGGKSKNKFVPYRDSVLTWLLKDNLGGNSKTAMIATISPSGDNYEETLSTLRYADRAKRIVNHAVVNEDPNAKIIRELREEVEKLKEQLNQAESLKAPELKEKLDESEKLIKDLTVTWEEKLRKTEEIAQERQKQLESMGISLESSGIKVGDDKCFLVNLNADPALNELLVYYLKAHTRVGADKSQDIQLCGIGIQPEHCVIDIAPDGDVILTPKENARTCLNGALLRVPNSLWHGDRILWGNNHFFRINLPTRKRRDKLKEYESEATREGATEQDMETASEASSEPDYSYEFAQMEVMMKALSSNDPVQNVVQILEKQYLEEKHNALEEQRLMYERELELLRQQLSPDKLHRHSIERLSFTSQTAQQKVKLWSEERDQLFRHSLAKLREQIVRANTLVREANFLAEEMTKQTDYQVTLQIPAANLSANRKRGAIVSEPAIQVRRRGKGTQVWTIEKLENKLIDMRDLYQDWKEKDMVEYYNKILSKRGDPFYEAQENHNLIGVANVFLECLYHDVRLQYAVPIISQQGEVAGRLHVELMRVSGAVPERLEGGDDSSENSSESGSYEVMDSNGEIVHMAKKLTCRVKIKEATGLPPNLSNFVFCQYTFWDHSEQTVAPPMVNPDMPSIQNKAVQYTVKFDHCKDFVVHVTEEFLEFISEGALAIEVWGHRCAGNGRTHWEVDALQAKTRTLRDRWSEVTRRIEMWISVQELNEMGEYTAVELNQAKDVNTGGVFQLRQGHSRRIQVAVKPVQHSGTLPLMVEAILAVSVGCITARSTKLQRPLDSYQKEEKEDMDSYQEEDLNEVREKWSDALMKRREYLDEQIQKVIKKQEKTEDDVEREARLVEQWVGLTEERNAVLVPAPSSGIPGAPADWIPLPGMEAHFPVLFLDLNADDLSANEQLTGPHAPGVNSILPKEHGSQFFYLPIIKHSEEEVSAVASWDTSVHDSVHLNKVTPQNERVYLIVKSTVQLSHPAAVELVLRKRIAVNVYNKQSFTQSLKRRMSYKNILHSCGVTYEIVSNIPKASEEPEDRETLALMAAKGEIDSSGNGETYIEKYTRGVLEVENILSLERLRQAVTVKEALSSKGRHMKRSISTPNVHHRKKLAEPVEASRHLTEVHWMPSIIDSQSTSKQSFPETSCQLDALSLTPCTTMIPYNQLMSVPVFTGAPGCRLDVEDWIKDMQWLLDTSSMSATLQFATVVHRLGGRAKKLVRDLPQKEQSPERAFERLRAEYMGSELPLDPMTEFYEKFKQPREMKTSYAVHSVLRTFKARVNRKRSPAHKDFKLTSHLMSGVPEYDVNQKPPSVKSRLMVCRTQPTKTGQPACESQVSSSRNKEPLELANQCQTILHVQNSHKCLQDVPELAEVEPCSVGDPSLSELTLLVKELALKQKDQFEKLEKLQFMMGFVENPAPPPVPRPSRSGTKCKEKLDKRPTRPHRCEGLHICRLCGKEGHMAKECKSKRELSIGDEKKSFLSSFHH